jgi:hypothetical protein
MRTARRLCAIPILVALSACSAAKPPAVAPDTRTPVRLAEAERLMRAGCLDCLVAAFGEYDLLRDDYSRPGRSHRRCDPCGGPDRVA